MNKAQQRHYELLREYYQKIGREVPPTLPEQPVPVKKKRGRPLRSDRAEPANTRLRKGEKRVFIPLTENQIAQMEIVAFREGRTKREVYQEAIGDYIVKSKNEQKTYNKH